MSGQPNKIFQQILAGTFKFNPAVHLQPRAPGLGPIFAPGRIAVLRRKLMLAGVDPVSVGIPLAETITQQIKPFKKPKSTALKQAKYFHKSF